MSKIPEDKRPTCSCGRKMIIVEYKGYYETFNYFYCGCCKADPDNYKAEDYVMGDFG